MISVTAAGAKELRPGADLSLKAGGSAEPVDEFRKLDVVRSTLWVKLVSPF